MTLSSATSDAVQETARALTGEAIARLFELRRGGNSRVYGVETSTGKRYALKRYPSGDQRGRQETEAHALAFIRRNGLDCVPDVVAMEPGSSFSLLSWIEGDPVTRISDADVLQFADFQIALDRVRDNAGDEIGEASEACLSGARILEHIRRRLDRLREVREGTPQFAAFFDTVLVAKFRAFERQARAAYDELGLDFDADLPQSGRTLIASDFGAHNALRTRDGRLAFLDFEYFGWDDPLTSIGNFTLHPGMELQPRQRSLYEQRLLAHFGGAEARLHALMPLYALRWSTIVLGELLPEKWQQRLESNPGLGDWDEVRGRQIAKAKAVLADYLGRKQSLGTSWP